MTSTPPSPIVRLLGLLRPMRGILFLSIVCRVGNHLLAMLLIVLAVGGVMRMVREPSAATLTPVVLALVGTGLVKGVFRYLEQFSGHYVAFRLLSDLRHLFYVHLERLSPAGLPGARSGDLVSRAMADIDRIEVFYAHTIAPVAVAVVAPPVALAAISFYSPILAIALVPWILAAGVIVPLAAHRLGRAPAAESRGALAELTAHFTDTIQGVREILAFGAEPERARALAAAGQRAATAQRRLARGGAFQSAATEILVGGATLTTLGLGALATRAHSLNPYDLPVVFALALAAFVPLLGVANLAPDLEQALRCARRVFAIFDRPSPLLPLPRGPASPRKGGGLAFENVTYLYPGTETPALDGLSFTAETGKITALAGESGAGKSTVLQLLLGFRPASAGHIVLAGQDLARLRAEEAREIVTVVPQQIHLFNFSVRENLLIARPGAPMADVESAARRARIHDFIRSLPQGYDTPLQELGARFSGGQRQRLAVARAFLRGAPVLVLDEASAHLDAANEQGLFASLRRWIEEDSRRTVLLISHRPSWVVRSDHAVVLKNGACAEAGSPALLGAAGGAYADLFSLPAD